MRWFILILSILFTNSVYAIEVPPNAFILDTVAYLNRVMSWNCKPTIPKRPLAPTKYFLTSQSVPKNILEASKSVRNICFCKNSDFTCATMTAIGKGRFVTNEHALEGLLRDKTRFESEKKTACGWYVATPNFGAEKINLQVLARGYWDHDVSGSDLNHSRDLSFIYIPELEQDQSFLMPASKDIRHNEKVFVMGYPIQNRYIPFSRKNLEPAISDGVVTSIYETNASADFVGVNGMSGGPVVNENGELVGIFWGKESNKRDDSLWESNALKRSAQGKPLLPDELPRETSYFIPVKYIIDTASRLSR